MSTASRAAEAELELLERASTPLDRPAPTAAPSPLIGEWLTKTEAAVYTKYSASTLERAVHAGELEAGGTPGRRRFRREWLDAWLIGLGALVALVVMLGALAVADAIPVRVPVLEPETYREDVPAALEQLADDASPKLGMPARRIDNDRLERRAGRA